MSEKVPVSILIPIRNEAANLPRCFASITWADEVFVVDSKSTDGSIEMAEKAGAKVVQFDFNGTWPKKKNWALENLPFKHPWVFILDADEELTPDAEEEFRVICTQRQPLIVGYWINRRFHFMGTWLKHAYYPNWNLRLFLHEKGRYEKLTSVETASGDNEVHEHVVVDGPIGHLKTEMNHYAFPNIGVFVEKHNRYSNWEARVALDQYLHKSGSTLQSDQVGFLRKLKAFSQKLPFRPTLRFLYVYLYQKGFLDGVEGYYFARLHAMYEFLCVAKTVELKKEASAKRAGEAP
jgi:glycosyltransferase involved in cell wall biosynthesis